MLGKQGDRNQAELIAPVIVLTLKKIFFFSLQHGHWQNQIQKEAKFGTYMPLYIIFGNFCKNFHAP